MEVGAFRKRHYDVYKTQYTGLGIFIFMLIGVICFTVGITVEVTPAVHRTLGVIKQYALGMCIRGGNHFFISFILESQL